MLVITTEEIPNIATACMWFIEKGSFAVHFLNHVACPVEDSSIRMDGKIVQKLSSQLLGEFCCSCSVLCNGVEGFEGSVVVGGIFSDSKALDVVTKIVYDVIWFNLLLQRSLPIPNCKTVTLRSSMPAVEPSHVLAMVAQITCPGAWLEHVMLVWVFPMW